ncbi:MAG: SDR family oxidoreductase [Pseudomonadota bacterium]
MPSPEPSHQHHRQFFSGETALVTGAASNIGRAIAVRLATAGARVIAVDVNEEQNLGTVDAIKERGGDATATTADLSTTDGWRALLPTVQSAAPDMFVHSACPRRHETDLVADVSEETFDAMLNTNLRSGFMLGRAIADEMAANKKRGRLLYITSLHTVTPRNLPHYSMSKAGMQMMVAEMARAYGPAGIRVNALQPGAVPGGGAASINDSFGADEKIALQRLGTAEDMAGPAVCLLSNELMGYVTGASLPVDGGLQHFSWIPMPSQE